MQACDFAIHHDYDTESESDIAKKIIRGIVINPLKDNRPIVFFIGGKSGMGKSYASIRIQEVLCELQNINILKCFDAINVYTPLQYPEKLQALLNDPKLKRVNILTVQEAREAMKAKLWNSFITQAIADVNAMSRAIKRLCIIIVSQSLKDITKELRYTVDYYCEINRPIRRAARIKIWRLYMDTRDLENIKLRKRRLWGFIVDKKTKRFTKYFPDHIELALPDPELCRMFDEKDKESKGIIIEQKTHKLMDQIKKDMETKDDRIPGLVNHYLKNVDQLLTIGKQTKKGWRANKEFREMYKFNMQDSRNFEEQLNNKLKEMGVTESGVSE
jgi:hypothetical protein